MPKNPWRILIVEDHEMVRKGLMDVLGRQEGMSVCGQADNVEMALVEIDGAQPDLVIVDMSLVDSNGLDLVRTLNRSPSSPKTIVFSSRPAWMMAERAMRAGAQGYLRKSTNDARIVDAVRTVMSGKTYVSEGGADEIGGDHPLLDAVTELSDLEYQVFELLAHGLDTAGIALKMQCSVNTVRTKLERARQKLEVSSTPELRRAAIAWRIDTLL